MQRSCVIGLLLVIFGGSRDVSGEDPLSANVIARLRDESLSGTHGPRLAWSADGSRLANARYRIGIWDANDGKQLVEMAGHGPAYLTKAGVVGVGFVKDGTRLISAGGDGAIRFWDTKTGTQVGEILSPFGMDIGGFVFPVPWYASAISPDCNLIAVSGHDQRVHVWNVESQKLVQSLGESSAEKIRKVTPAESGDFEEIGEFSKFVVTSSPQSLFSSDSKSLAISGPDDVTVWDVNTWKLLYRIADRGACAFSPDGRHLVTAKYEGVKIWNAKTGEPVGEFTDNIKIFTPLTFTPDGSLLTGSADANGIRLWSFPEGRLKRSFVYGGAVLSSLAVSPNGNVLAAAVRQSRVLTWDLKNNERMSGAGHSEHVTALAFSPDDRMLISGSWDASVRAWDTSTWKPLAVRFEPKMYVSAIRFMPGENRILVGDSGKTRLLTVPELTVLRTSEHLDEHRTTVAGYVIRDDQVVVGIDGFQKGYFESRDREMLHPTKTPVHGTYGLRMTVSRDHSLVASGDYDGNVVVWRDSPAAVVSKFHVEGTVVQAMVDLPKKSGREEKRSMLHLEESSGCQKIVVSLVLSISEKP